MHKLIASNMKAMATCTILFYKSLVVYRNSFVRTNDTKKTEFLGCIFYASGELIRAKKVETILFSLSLKSFLLQRGQWEKSCCYSRYTHGSRPTITFVVPVSLWGRYFPIRKRLQNSRHISTLLIISKEHSHFLEKTSL